MNTRQPARYEFLQTLEGSEIGFSRINEAKRYISFHWHDSIEILHILSGKMTIHLTGGNVMLKEGDSYLINLKQLHSTSSSEDNSFLLLELPQTFLEKHIPNFDTLTFQLNCGNPDPKHQTKLMHFNEIFFQMDALIEIKPEGFQMRFHSLIFELLFQLFHNFSVKKPLRENIASRKNQERLSSIVNYVYAHYQENISIEEIASYCHLQPQYFCRFFKRNMGYTFLEFVNEVRLYYIYEDIINTDMTIKDITALHGFYNYDLFLRLFREKHNCLPHELRKLYRST